MWHFPRTPFCVYRQFPTRRHTIHQDQLSFTVVTCWTGKECSFQHQLSLLRQFLPDTDNFLCCNKFLRFSNSIKQKQDSTRSKVNISLGQVREQSNRHYLPTITVHVVCNIFSQFHSFSCYKRKSSPARTPLAPSKLVAYVLVLWRFAWFTNDQLHSWDSVVVQPRLNSVTTCFVPRRRRLVSIKRWYPSNKAHSFIRSSN